MFNIIMINHINMNAYMNVIMYINSTWHWYNRTLSVQDASGLRQPRRTRAGWEQHAINNNNDIFRISCWLRSASVNRPSPSPVAVRPTLKQLEITAILLLLLIIIWIQHNLEQ